MIRRVTYDLTGLPPTPEEVEEFVADASPNAYEKVVDVLLASPRYGEHRAHYWLDVARYGDTHGLPSGHFRRHLALPRLRHSCLHQNNLGPVCPRTVAATCSGKTWTLCLLGYLPPDQRGEGGTLIEELRVITNASEPKLWRGISGLTVARKLP